MRPRGQSSYSCARMSAREDGSVKRRTANLSLAMQQGCSFEKDRASEFSNRIGDKEHRRQGSERRSSAIGAMWPYRWPKSSFHKAFSSTVQGKAHACRNRWNGAIIQAVIGHLGKFG